MNSTEKENKIMIDLNNFRSPNSKVYSGRDRGKAVKNDIGLDKLIEKKQHLLFKIPEDIFSISPSFFLGLFGHYVKSLGEQQFRNLVEFECTDVIKGDIEIGISRALKDSSVI